MTDSQQIALAIAPAVLPTLTVLIAILVNNRQIDGLGSEIYALRSEMNSRFSAVERSFHAVGRELSLTRDMFREQLLRVEGVIDARLKHLEEREH